MIVDYSFGFGGRPSLVFIKGRQYYKDYIQQVEKELLSCGSDYGGENWMHQQEGSSIHTA